MFYWTHLFDKYIKNSESLNEEEIKRIIYSFTLDFTRYISRLNNPKYRKYVYTAQIELFHLMENKIVKYNDEKNSLELNFDENLIVNFRTFLGELMNVTDNIKDIYDTVNKQREENMTSYYNEENFGLLKKLHKNF